MSSIVCVHSKSFKSFICVFNGIKLFKKLPPIFLSWVIRTITLKAFSSKAARATEERNAYLFFISLQQSLGKNLLQIVIKKYFKRTTGSTAGTYIGVIMPGCPYTH